jgi:hypothetical protein
MSTPRQFIKKLPDLADVITLPNLNAAFKILLTKNFSTMVLPSTGLITEVRAAPTNPEEEACDGFACFTDEALNPNQTARKEEAE